ncbi:MAG: DUF3179 domain-containing protein [Alphaproteobacteria bacterium]|nr:DUF3179 domain-containing protein [Alphaproteobacteria bacterium]
MRPRRSRSTRDSSPVPAFRPAVAQWSRRSFAGAALLASVIVQAPDCRAQAPGWPGVPQGDPVFTATLGVAIGPPSAAQSGLRTLLDRGTPDAAAGLILALRYNRRDARDIGAALARLTGAPAAETWDRWMLWQETHPSVRPHASYAALTEAVHSLIDPAFSRFLGPSRIGSAARTAIRIEEITWGGVQVDGIPALVDPAHVPAAEAGYLGADEPVFGVALNGEARAYPLRILDWHEMANDVVGGVPVALAYCTLCGAGILFEARAPGRDERFVFGSSGLLYRSNKLMHDRATDSLWNQFAGTPVVGPLVGSGIALKILPVVVTSWGAWRTRHPRTSVLSLRTGHDRDYEPGRSYGRYFASPDLMFPAAVTDQRRPQKDIVFGIRAVGGAKAWPVEVLARRPVINDRVGALDVVLLRDGTPRGLRAYERGGRQFKAADATGAALVDDAGTTWLVQEDALVGPDRQRLPRVAGHLAYWFAWAGYMGERAELAE